MNNSKSLSKLPFFYILSMGRSGSTLLEFLLDAHPNINIPLESPFIIHLHTKYAKKTIWNKKDKLAFIKDLYTDYKFTTFWNINKENLEHEIINSSPNISFFELCRIITSNYISFYPKEEIKIQGSKNPLYALWCKELFQLNKKGKFIHLVRNPMGVVASQKKLNNNYAPYFAFRWNLFQKKIEALKHKNLENFITINYEELIANPEIELKRISTFLKVDYHPEQLKFNEAVKKYQNKITNNNELEKINVFESHLKNLVNPINTSYSDSWAKTLTEKEIEEISFITHKTANNYGYNLPQSGNFKWKFIPILLKIKYDYLKLRLYYKLSLSIRLK